MVLLQEITVYMHLSWKSTEHVPSIFMQLNNTAASISVKNTKLPLNRNFPLCMTTTTTKTLSYAPSFHSLPSACWTKYCTLWSPWTLTRKRNRQRYGSRDDAVGVQVNSNNNENRKILNGNGIVRILMHAKASAVATSYIGSHLCEILCSTLSSKTKYPQDEECKSIFRKSLTNTVITFIPYKLTNTWLPPKLLKSSVNLLLRLRLIQSAHITFSSLTFRVSW